MPLPDSSQVWPPKNLSTIFTTVKIWHAWFANDTKALGAIYGTSGTVNQTVWGQIKRWFWGQAPSDTGQAPNKLHVDIAARVARMSSNLLYSQMPDVSFPEPDTAPTKPSDGSTVVRVKTATQKATERLNELLDDNTHARLLENGQYQSALGGGYLRVTWDKAASPDRPFITTATTEQAVPTFRWGRLVAVTFWVTLGTPDGDAGVYRLLESHEPGTVEWGLYHSLLKDELGQRVPLTQHEATAHLATSVNERAVVLTGSDLLTAVYMPNILPNPMWDKDPVGANFGRSDFDGAEPFFDALDEAYTSWMRDIRLGKARIIVPKGLIKNLGNGQGGSFNADQEVFVETGELVGSLNPSASDGGVKSFITMFQPNIRWQEHQKTCEDLIGQIYESCGYSASTFGESGDVAMTATESSNREKLSVLTRGAKILYARPQLVNLFAALMDVDQYVFGGPGRADTLPDIEFPDAAAENPLTLAQTLQALAIAEAVSTKTKVSMLHEDWDEPQIDEEVELIKEETKAPPMTDPTFDPFGPEADDVDTEPGTDEQQPRS